MKISYETHYDREYWERKKSYQDPLGREQIYIGPGKVWEGFDLVAEALSSVIRPNKGDTMLDIGCSFGDFARRMKTRGWDPYGIDISHYAIDNCVQEMAGRIQYGDITQHPNLDPFPQAYDLVTALDLCEHIYEEDAEPTFRWIADRSKKWLFFCVAVASHPQNPLTMPQEFVAKKGEPIPPEWEQTAVSGHVNVRHFRYWRRLFHKMSLRIRWDLMYTFQMFRECNPGWKDTGGWNMPTTWFLEKR